FLARKCSSTSTCPTRARRSFDVGSQRRSTSSGSHLRIECPSSSTQHLTTLSSQSKLSSPVSLYSCSCVASDLEDSLESC
ncbi:hypothetical protein AAVH_34315, partial [Aphelenchoides avenae]